MTTICVTAAVCATAGAVIGYQVAAWAWAKASGEGR